MTDEFCVLDWAVSRKLIRNEYFWKDWGKDREDNKIFNGIDSVKFKLNYYSKVD